MTRVLVVNAGSSTLKLRVLDGGEVVAAHDVDPWDGTAEGAGLAAVLDEAPPVGAVGHRVVHGGRQLTRPTVVTDEVERAVAALTSLAPLHQPRSLAALAAARAALPDVPHVACFDTAFHAGLPPAARTYALPRDWRDRWDLGRFGFHGLSHAWAAARGPAVAGLSPEARVVSCHLGAGASLCAVVGGRSVDTTMGFTPLDGLVMATRAGAVDPGLLLWLQEEAGIPVAELREALERRSGLVGLAGDADMRGVLEARAAGDADAALALAVYVHRLRQGVAAMAASAGGLDLLVFTGGVGEHAPAVRRAVADGLAFLGVAVDPVADEAADEAADGDADLTAAGAAVRTVVVTSREDLEIERQVLATVGPLAEPR